jgi:hypothetical protein
VTVTIEEFRAVSRNTLRGFARVRLGGGMIMHDVGVHVSNGSAWASPPGKPMLDRSGAVMKDAAGKPQYSPLVTFIDKATRDRFSAAVVEAVKAQYPAALT